MVVLPPLLVVVVVRMGWLLVEDVVVRTARTWMAVNGAAVGPVAGAIGDGVTAAGVVPSGLPAVVGLSSGPVASPWPAPRSDSRPVVAASAGPPISRAAAMPTMTGMRR